MIKNELQSKKTSDLDLNLVYFNITRVTASLNLQ